jgi:cob(I)alamin adenosyltransferase
MVNFRIPKTKSEKEAFRHARGKGIVVVNTGGGKGKTTAALGTAIRAAGYGLQVAIIQFIKGSWFYGELEALKKFPNVKLIKAGKGFIGIIDDKLPLKEHQKAAQKAWELTKKVVNLGKYDLVVIDELNYAVHYKLVDPKEVVKLIKGRPEFVDLVITGNFARPEVIKAADTVTEMKEIKHAFGKGLKAKRGVDY